MSKEERSSILDQVIGNQPTNSLSGAIIVISVLVVLVH